MMDGSGYNFDEIKTGIDDGDRFPVEPHHLMKIGDELVMGGWFAGLISLRLNRTCAAAPRCPVIVVCRL